MKIHPLRRVGIIANRINQGEKSHNEMGKYEAKYGRQAPEMMRRDKKRKKLLEELLKMKKRRTTPYTPAQMQNLHRVDVAGMRNQKIMRKGPS